MRFLSSNISIGIRPQHIFPDEVVHYCNATASYPALTYARFRAIAIGSFDFDITFSLSVTNCRAPLTSGL